RDWRAIVKLNDKVELAYVNDGEG
ncbi:MAG: hypothetical protein ACD_45C00001G0001, partial [uncultured bacterium]